MKVFLRVGSTPFRAAGLKIFSGFCFAGLTLVARFLGTQGFHVPFWICFTEAVLALFMLWGLSPGPGPFHLLWDRRWALLLWSRSAFAFFSLLFWTDRILHSPVLFVTSFKLLMPFVTLILLRVFVGERLSRGQQGLLGLAFGGAVLMMAPPEGFAWGGTQGDGGALLLLCVGGFSASHVLGKVILARGLPPLAAAQCLFAGMTLFACLSLPWARTQPFPPLPLWPALGLVGLASALGVWSWHKAVSLGDLSPLLPLGFLRFFFISLGGILFFHESRPASFWAGAALLVLCELGILRLHQKKEAQG